MTAENKDAPAEQIIIIRRRDGGGDEGHHGGVWKIAYADFMTAMMAFFLVMWLINAANTETKASVASYFNPIKLTDTHRHKKGLRDPDAKPDQSETPQGPNADQKQQNKEKENKSKPTPKDGASEGAPSKGAQPSARNSGSDAQASGQGRDVAANASQTAGTAFRDPFNPLGGARLLSESAQMATRSEAGTAGQKGSESGKAEVAVAAERAQTLATEAAAVRLQAEAALRRAGASGGPGVDVTIEGEAIVLSLTDTTSFGMFAVGSAEPNTELVKFIASIAPVISANSERVLVRGHTDSRPFRVETRNGNWRLAMARAEASYAMLLRSGIEEARFERIEAYADRKPKINGSPEAAANRRIEILLLKARP